MRQAHQATAGTVAGAGGPPAPAGIAVAAPTVTAPAAEVDGHKRTQTQQPAQPYTKNMTAPPAAVDGHTAPPDPAAEAVIPAMPPIATGKRILTGSKTPGKTLQSDGSATKTAPPAKGGTAAAASETKGGREANASTPSWVSRLASRPGSTARKRVGARYRPLDRERVGRACDR